MNFDEALLQGFASDGGLFVPQTIPKISCEQLRTLSGLCYTDLAFEILSLFIDPGIIPKKDLRQLIEKSVASFEHPDTLMTIQKNFRAEPPYLLDPHGAVAMAAARALGPDLPDQAFHPSLIKASQVCQKLRICDCEHLESALVRAIENQAKKNKAKKGEAARKEGIHG